MNAKQDFNQIQGEDAPEIKAFMAGRHAVAILNNGLGHVIYVVQLVQDIATASVVGVEVDAVTIPLNELLLGIKVGVDSVQFLADFGLTCAAQYRSMKAPPGRAPPRGPPGTAWSPTTRPTSSATSSRGIFDIIDLSSAGFANAGRSGRARGRSRGVFDTAKFVKGLIKSVLQGWFGVWGGKAFERGAPRRRRARHHRAPGGRGDPARAPAMKRCLHGRRRADRRGRRPHRQAAGRAQRRGDARARRPGPVRRGARRGRRGARPRRAAHRRPHADAGDGHDRRREGRRRSTPGPRRRAGRSTAPGARHRHPRGGHRRRRAVRPRRGRAQHGGARSRAPGLQLLVDQLNAGVDELKSTLTPPGRHDQGARDRPRRVHADRDQRGARADHLDAGAGRRHQGEAREVQLVRGRREHDHPADLRTWSGWSRTSRSTTSASCGSRSAA